MWWVDIKGNWKRMLLYLLGSMFGIVPAWSAITITWHILQRILEYSICVLDLIFIRESLDWRIQSIYNAFITLIRTIFLNDGINIAMGLVTEFYERWRDSDRLRNFMYRISVVRQKFKLSVRQGLRKGYSRFKKSLHMNVYLYSELTIEAKSKLKRAVRRGFYYIVYSIKNVMIYIMIYLYHKTRKRILRLKIRYIRLKWRMRKVPRIIRWLNDWLLLTPYKMELFEFRQKHKVHFRLVLCRSKVIYFFHALSGNIYITFRRIETAVSWTRWSISKSIRYIFIYKVLQCTVFRIFRSIPFNSRNFVYRCKSKGLNVIWYLSRRPIKLYRLIKMYLRMIWWPIESMLFEYHYRFTLRWTRYISPKTFKLHMFLFKWTFWFKGHVFGALRFCKICIEIFLSNQYNYCVYRVRRILMIWNKVWFKICRWGGRVRYILGFVFSRCKYACIWLWRIPYRVKRRLYMIGMRVSISIYRLPRTIPWHLKHFWWCCRYSLHKLGRKLVILWRTKYVQRLSLQRYFLQLKSNYIICVYQWRMKWYLKWFRFKFPWIMRWKKISLRWILRREIAEERIIRHNALMRELEPIIEIEKLQWEFWWLSKRITFDYYMRLLPKHYWYKMSIRYKFPLWRLHYKIYIVYGHSYTFMIQQLIEMLIPSIGLIFS
jgi:hypothetical protein